MSEQAFCRNCDETIERGDSGVWAHIVGPGSRLIRCDPTRSGKPYGLEAEPRCCNVKPGNYSDGRAIPICELLAGHDGDHEATPLEIFPGIPILRQFWENAQQGLVEGRA